MDIVLWLLFTADSVVNVAACALSKQRLRRFSKVLLVPLLFCAYAVSARGFLPQVAAALFFGWLGDIFMMYKDDRHMLAAGMLSFGAGHIFYIGAVFSRFGFAPPVWAAVAVPALFLFSAVGFYLSLRRHISDGLRPFSLLYGLLLSSLGAVSAIFFLSGGHGGALLTAGALCFLASDGILSLETFRHGDSPGRDFAVMLTYITAQALIVLSLAL